jgi:hypothetical protein
MKEIDFRNMDHFAAASEILRQAVASGLIEWTWADPEQDCIITPKVLAYAETLFKDTRAQDTGDLENAGVSPKSIHFRTDSRGRRVHPDEQAPYREWTVELARFIVPDGHVGVVKGIDQYLAAQWDIPDGVDAFVWSQNSRWGVPGAWYADLAAGSPIITDLGVWHFRLHNITQRGLPPWYDATGPAPLPDLPYTDFPFDSQLWFPAGSASSQNVHLIIPAGHVLRVLYVAPEQDARFEAACKLRGFVQSDRTPESSLNVRTNW